MSSLSHPKALCPVEMAYRVPKTRSVDLLSEELIDLLQEFDAMLMTLWSP